MNITLDEIRSKAPEGATHYKQWGFDNSVDYIRVIGDGVYDSWFGGAWVSLPYQYFSKPLTIKPL